MAKINGFAYSESLTSFGIKKEKEPCSTALHRGDASKPSTRKGTAALLTTMAKDQGEDMPNKTMNESSAKAERKPDWSPAQRQHALIRHIQTQSEKNDRPAPLIWIIQSAYL